ncbi:hypothetical protein D3C71_451410 [compost metagenome]
MTKTILLNTIEKEYQLEIEKLLQTVQSLTADHAIELSKKLHSEIKAKGISPNVHPDDMLLFQYGTYNWGEESGQHFSFNITRQFSKKNFDLFQLSLTFLFEPVTVNSYNSWSMDFQTLDEWSDHIKTTEGYQLAKTLNLKTYKLTFSKV